jgi:hypothetical protein
MALLLLFKPRSLRVVDDLYPLRWRLSWINDLALAPSAYAVR